MKLTIDSAVLPVLLLVMSCVDGGRSACRDGEARCEGRDLVACESGKEVRFSCSGPSGCQGGACDLSGSTAGTACPRRSEGQSVCSSDGNAALQCQAGVMTKVADCRSCRVSADELICDPP